MGLHTSQVDKAFGVASKALLALYTLEIGLAAILFGLYKASTFDVALLATKAGILLLTGVALAVVAIATTLRLIRRDRRGWLLALSTNVISVDVVLALGEVVVRSMSRPSANGITVGSIAIRPTWSELREQIHGMRADIDTFFISDPEIGWTVGPNRRSANGLYSSSAEGLRSAVQGVRLSDEQSDYRVALIGDSNAFSLEVPFEDSLGYHLAQILGDRAQVLNFGVDAYGIDQIYMRYRRDVRPWKPKVVIVAFIQHDLMRTMMVYPFIGLGWPGHLVKPRFDVVDGQIVEINKPLPSRTQIMQTRSMRDLPFIAYDEAYASEDWEWRFDDGPMLLRFLTSLSPRWVGRPVSGNADTETLNSGLLNQLTELIERDGATPILVYLPHWTEPDPLARSTIARSGLKVMDMTQCLSRVPADQRLVPSGHHYTGSGNRAIAQCTAPPVRCAAGLGCD